MDILSDAQSQQLDRAVERALAWLARQQQRDGAFPTLPQGQPGVTSLCLLAFMSHGHLPGEGPFGDQLDRAVRFIAAQQKSNGLLSAVAQNRPTVVRTVSRDEGSVTAYNHAISALALSEAFAAGGQVDIETIRQVIERALEASLAMQRFEKRTVDQGGWRYVNPRPEADSDLSITGWELMFLRSAKNAGFDVPEQAIDAAVAYVQRCFNAQFGTFEYEINNLDSRSRGMAGAGVLALAHAGFHNSREAQAAGDWILRHKFDQFNELEYFAGGASRKDRYHYGVFNCCQAMYQLGGDYWREFFPSTAMTLVANQRSDGSWPVDPNPNDGRYGTAYATSLVTLALGAPNQLLPIFQR